jgi:DNA gyrase/topoisomerase IV subunit A
MVKKVKAKADKPEKKAKKVKKGKGAPIDFASDMRSIVAMAKTVTDVHLEDKANEEYYKYGIAVIEDRAIFGSIDGLKPVARRALWSAHKAGLRHNVKADKSAKVVGDTLANYHPHGDMACYGAIITAAKSPMNLVDGEGNWGTMNDGAAAYRYTNMRLSLYSDLVFFDPFYLPTIDYVPNYDGSKMEPLILPALLPNTILNGNFGITPGVNTRTPSFGLKSTLAVVRKAIKEGACTAKMCMDLEFTTKYGGKAVYDKEEFKRFYKTGRGAVTFRSTHTDVDVRNEIRFDEFAPISDIEKVLAKVEGVAGVVKTRDDSDKHDKHQVAYVVQFAKSCKGDALKTALKKVNEAFSASWRFSVQVTDRFLNPDGTEGAKLRPTTVPALIQHWIDYRIKLEQDACTYWIKKRKEEIAKLELMRLAVKMRDFILKALKKECSEDELAKYIAKGLKITVDQANQILDLKVRQLRALEDKALVAKIKDLEKEYKTYEGRKKNPAKYVLEHIDSIEEQLAAAAAKKAKAIATAKEKSKSKKSKKDKKASDE